MLEEIVEKLLVIVLAGVNRKRPSVFLEHREDQMANFVNQRWDLGIRVLPIQAQADNIHIFSASFKGFHESTIAFDAVNVGASELILDDGAHSLRIRAA
jgi:hypothetical protein